MTTEAELRKANKEMTLPEGREKTDYTKEEATFYFKYEAPNGKVFEGDFTNHILTTGEIGTAGANTSRLNGGMPYESISPMVRDLNDRLGHLVVSLRNRPEWANELTSIKYRDVIYLLYREVEKHEAIFCGRRSAEESGEGEDK